MDILYKVGIENMLMVAAKISKTTRPQTVADSKT